MLVGRLFGNFFVSTSISKELSGVFGYVQEKSLVGFQSEVQQLELVVALNAVVEVREGMLLVELLDEVEVSPDGSGNFPGLLDILPRIRQLLLVFLRDGNFDFSLDLNLSLD